MIKIYKKFTELLDVGSLVGKASKGWAVKADESGMEFVSVAVLGETETTAYRGDRGKIAYDHSQLITGNPHAVTKSDVGLSVVENTALSTWAGSANITTVGDLTAYAKLLGRAGGQTLIGGSAVTDILKLQGTSGNGTLTSPAIQFLVGNNGATIAGTILNNGYFGIGTSPAALVPTSPLVIGSDSMANLRLDMLKRTGGGAYHSSSIYSDLDGAIDIGMNCYWQKSDNNYYRYDTSRPAAIFNHDSGGDFAYYWFGAGANPITGTAGANIALRRSAGEPQICTFKVEPLVILTSAVLNTPIEAIRITTAQLVGIGGVSAPGSRLSVNGGISAGDATYAATAAPTGGMIIKGNVGVGITVPLSKFNIHSLTGANEAFTLSGDDIAHPFTGLLNTKIGARLNFGWSANGGVVLQGFTDADKTPFYFQGHIGSTTPTMAVIEIAGYKSDGGTNRTALTGTEKVVAIITTGNNINFFANSNIGIGVAALGTSAVNVIGVATGTAPSTSPADMFQMWSADIVAGEAAPHFRTEHGDIIKLYQQAHIINADGNLADITTKFNTLLGYLENTGLLATS